MLGKRLEEKLENGQERFGAIVSAAEDDEHPRKTVTRASIHRGAAMPAEYPTEQEELQNVLMFFYSLSMLLERKRNLTLFPL